MIILIIFAFLAGIVTILSPCILPALPIVLSGTIAGDKRKPLGLVVGFILSFTFFTLFLTTIVNILGISADILRNLAAFIIALFGLTLIFPQFQAMFERLVSPLTSRTVTPNNGVPEKSGFLSGFLLGIGLGLVWTPCVGPILGSVIALAATSKITSQSIFITLAYSLGTAIPLLAITFGGRQLLLKFNWLTAKTSSIQKVFGILMILTAILIYFHLDTRFQSFVLQKFPAYGTGLTIDNNSAVNQALPAVSQNTSSISNPLQNISLAPELIPGGQWFNTQPLTLKGLHGKVVVLDFWTYTCINCIRTLPYVKNWWDKYKDKGLVIIGVHTPEFAFEHEANNVATAIKDFGITYPVMQDNNYATWNAYGNQYWPAEYFIDVNGKIRFTHFGEGNYDESEQNIQTLLKEAKLLTTEMPINNPTYNINAQTPETYVGYSRLGNFSSPEGVTQDQAATYTVPTNLPTDSFAFDGTWTIGGEQTTPAKGASLVFNFNAQNVYLVMRPKVAGTSGTVKILLDGKVVSTGAGDDVKDGIVTVDTDRLYTLIKLAGPGRHLLQLQFLDNNLELYAFTFG